MFRLMGLHPGHRYVKVNSNLLQSYKFFHHVKPKLRQIFQFSDSLTNYVDVFAAQLFKFVPKNTSLFIIEKTCRNDTYHKLCVHTRLGDFKHHPYLLPSKHSFTNPAIDFAGKELLVSFFY